MERALALRRIGPYTIQAAIAAVHANAATADATDWDEIVTLYDVLVRKTPLAEVTVETKMPGLFLVPANLAMSTVDVVSQVGGMSASRRPNSRPTVR